MSRTGRRGHFLGVTVQPMVRTWRATRSSSAAASTRSSGRCCCSASGGRLVEVYEDRALGLPPLNTTLARRMMEQTRVFAVLQGVRGRRPVDIERARRAARAVQPPRRRAALDQGDRHQPAARVARSPRRARRARRRARPRGGEGTTCPPLAIRPYPTQYVAPFTLKNGGRWYHPADPARGRAADGRGSTRGCRSAASTSATSTSSSWGSGCRTNG